MNDLRAKVKRQDELLQTTKQHLASIEVDWERTQQDNEDLKRDLAKSHVELRELTEQMEKIIDHLHETENKDGKFVKISEKSHVDGSITERSDVGQESANQRNKDIEAENWILINDNKQLKDAIDVVSIENKELAAFKERHQALQREASQRSSDSALLFSRIEELEIKNTEISKQVKKMKSEAQATLQ